MRTGPQGAGERSSPLCAVNGRGGPHCPWRLQPWWPSSVGELQTLLCLSTAKRFPLFFSNKFIIYFIYFWRRWVFVAACGLSLIVVSGGYSSLRCAGFSLWWLLLLWSTGSRRVGFSSCGSWALECRVSSSGAWAQLLRGMWDLPGPGIEPMSPALAGGFLTAAPPGKSPHWVL